ncbi:thioesterase II family protein [Streptomyces sp. NPDC002742]|jgi:surfactin synthase thioesterase subunit|uniref:thioesterase II family protein n=1 Tax=Streptomyces sp. NPDC002742 TaxID=3364663 RepID=UPI003674CD90
MTIALMCLPYAGAGASLFRPWREQPDRAFQVTPIQLPGREERFIEDPYTSVGEAAAGCAERVTAAAQGRQFALFGHSFGAVIAYETARLLVADGAPLPQRLIVSGAAAPGVARPYLGVDGLSDDELVERVGALAGYDHEAFADPDLRELIVPALRADMAINETYRPGTVDPLPVPITVLRGMDDDLVTRMDAELWSGHTTAGYELLDMPGGHMYFAEDWQGLWAKLDVVLRDVARRLP